MVKKYYWFKIIIIICTVLFIGFGFLTLLLNLKPLYLGINYLFFSHNKSVKTIEKSGDFSTIYDLVKLNDKTRADYIRSYIETNGIKYISIPTSLGSENIFVYSSLQNDVRPILFVAHYDTFLDYKGALDNTGSVGVLLAALKEVKNEISHGKVAFLFSTNEEDGLIGTREFIKRHVKNRNLQFTAVINLDCVGRGKTIAVSSGTKAGLKLFIPLFGNILVSNKGVEHLNHYWKLDSLLTDLEAYGIGSEPDIISFSDTSSFLEKGIPAFHLTSDDMNSIVKYSHKDSDSIEILDEDSLKKIKDAIVQISKKNNLF